MGLPSNTLYEDTFDLRKIVKTVLKYWKPVIITTLFGAISAFLFSKFSVDPQYEASAYLTIVKPASYSNLEPLIQTVTQYPEPQQVAELATSDEILLNVYQDQRVREGLGDEIPFNAFRGNVETKEVGFSLVKLTVNDGNPETAALIANIWAENASHRVNSIFGSSRESLELLTTQREVARQNLHIAQEALEDLLPVSRLNGLRAKIEQARYEIDINLLKKISKNDSIIHDAQALVNRLGIQNQTNLLSPGDALSLVILQMRAVSSEPPGNPIFYTLPESNIFGQGYTINQAQEALGELADSLQIQNQLLKNTSISQEARLASLVTELEIENFKFEQLTSERNLALKNYDALSGELGEARLRKNRPTEISARAFSPEDPAGISEILISILVGTAGFMLAVGTVFVYEWWQEPEVSEQANK